MLSFAPGLFALASVCIRFSAQVAWRHSAIHVGCIVLMQKLTGRKKAHINTVPPRPRIQNVRFCSTFHILNSSTTRAIYLYPRQPYCNPTNISTKRILTFTSSTSSPVRSPTKFSQHENERLLKSFVLRITIIHPVWLLIASTPSSWRGLASPSFPSFDLF